MPEFSRPGWSQNLLAILAGLILPLAFAPASLVPLAFISTAVLVWLWRNASPRQAMRTGFLYGMGYFGYGVYWIYVVVHDIGQSSSAIAILLTVLLAAFLSLYVALSGWLAVKLRGRTASVSWYLLVIPAAWVTGEWLRGWIFNGFPWLQIGYSQIDTPLAGLAPWAGLHSVSWATMLTTGLLLVILFYRGRTRWLSAAALAGLWGIAWLAGTVTWTTPVGEPIKVSIIQGNAPQITKWDPEKIQLRLDLYATLTNQHWDSDLILWPENALTTYYHQLEDNYLRVLQEQAVEHGTDIVFGVPYMDLKTREYYSAMASIGSTPGIYKKRHLVPFGEFIPLGSVLRRLVDFFNLPMTGFSSGDKNQPHLVAAGQPLSVTVCYEDAFGNEVIDYLPEATLLVNGSNNAWYGDSSAPHQHLQISRMRAVETQRPLIRATTNGISAFVDYRGRIVSASPQFKTFVLTGTVQPRKGATPYIRMGNYLIISLLFALLLAGGWLSRKQTD